ncbi:MAG TPA: DUF4783 domain-containing protein [Chitinophagales bacterium]|nr:DUF4783 domain-containing protein [Chitinophagales bacterium]
MSFKKLIQFVFILTFLWVGGISVSAQDFKGKISTALSGGNIKELSRSFDKRVQVTIDNKTNYYSSSQAEIIVRDHLAHLGNRSFTLIKSGTSSNQDGEFYIGQINCSKGSVKVYIYATKVADVYNIHEIRFEKH